MGLKQAGDDVSVGINGFFVKFHSASWGWFCFEARPNDSMLFTFGATNIWKTEEELEREKLDE
jgi:hypothetical protein